jgi:hypothetical protein
MKSEATTKGIGMGLPNTYYVYVKVGQRGQQRIMRYAQTKTEAVAAVKAEGREVVRIQLMPVPPRGGRR